MYVDIADDMRDAPGLELVPDLDVVSINGWVELAPDLAPTPKSTETSN